MRTFNRILSFIGGSVRRLVVLAALALLFGGQFLGWWNTPSLVNINVPLPSEVTQKVNEVLLPPPTAKMQDIWTSGDENATSHFIKHGKEFPFPTKDAYVMAAMDFVMNPPPGTQSVVQSDGDHVYYNEQKNYFAVTNRAGKLRTFFRLDPRIHGYPTNMDYFRAQERR